MNRGKKANAHLDVPLADVKIPGVSLLSHYSGTTVAKVFEIEDREWGTYVARGVVNLEEGSPAWRVRWRQEAAEDRPELRTRFVSEMETVLTWVRLRGELLEPERFVIHLQLGRHTYSWPALLCDGTPWTAPMLVRAQEALDGKLSFDGLRYEGPQTEVQLLFGGVSRQPVVT